MNTELLTQLSQEDFALDDLGRMVIKNKELLQEINGAAGIFQIPGGTCGNRCGTGCC